MVQRGECAIYDKWQRAKEAVKAGADLVIELPAYYVLQSADVFAKGAVEILDRCKIVDAISFGCELGNTDKLYEIADIMSWESYNSSVKEFINMGQSYPKACENALLRFLPDANEDIFKPNNTLGICYIKAIKNLGSKMKTLCVKRNNDYHSDKTNDEYMSASQIRKMIVNNEDYSKYADMCSDKSLYLIKNAETYILGTLRNSSADKLRKIKGYEDGLGELIINSAKKACTLDELFEMCVSKRYTLHRIKRFVMCAMLDISYEEKAEYVRVLAIGKNGGKLLKEIKEKSDLSIITKLADYKSSNLMIKTDIAASDFAALCAEDVKLRYGGKDYTTTPYIKKSSQ